MRKKILSKIFISIISLTIISTAIVSSVFAKYTVGPVQRGVSTRPAIFDVVFDGGDPVIEVSFAADGEPGSPVGYSTAEKHYDFSVLMVENEVRTDCEIEVYFPQRIFEKIVNASSYDKTHKEGLYCSYKVYKINDDASLTDITSQGSQDSTKKTWTYTEKVSPQQSLKFRLEFTFYNNTTMDTENGNIEDFLYVAGDLEVTATARQVLD